MPILPEQNTIPEPKLFTDQYLQKVENEYVINYKPVDVDAILNAAK